MLDLTQNLQFENTPSDLRERRLVDIVLEGKLVIAPWLGQRILTEARFAGQDARLKAGQINRHVGVLETIMRRGIFRDGGSISFVRLGDRLWLINGYHRLTALVRTGHTVQFRVAVDDVGSEADIAAAFHHFDRVQFDRTDAQVLAALGVAEKHEMSKSAASACWAAIPFLSNDLQPAHGNHQSDEVTAANRDSDLRADAAAPWWEFAANIERALKPASTETRTKMFKGGRFAVAMLTARHQPQKAWDFWNGLALDDGLRTGDPRKALLKDLNRRRISAGSVIDTVLQVAVPWNSWFRGGSMQDVKLPSDRAIRVLGTPFAEVRRS